EPRQRPGPRSPESKAHVGRAPPRRTRHQANTPDKHDPEPRWRFESVGDRDPSVTAAHCRRSGTRSTPVPGVPLGPGDSSSYVQIRCFDHRLNIPIGAWSYSPAQTFGLIIDIDPFLGAVVHYGPLHYGIMTTACLFQSQTAQGVLDTMSATCLRDGTSF